MNVKQLYPASLNMSTAQQLTLALFSQMTSFPDFCSMFLNLEMYRLWYTPRIFESHWYVVTILSHLGLKESEKIF